MDISKVFIGVCTKLFGKQFNSGLCYSLFYTKLESYINWVKLSESMI